MVFGSFWFQGKWPLSWKRLHINFLEMYPVLMAFIVFSKKLRNARIRFYCDDSCVVECLNKLTSKSKDLMKVIRPLACVLMVNNITVKFIHTPGVENKLCDLLSRQTVLLGEESADRFYSQSSLLENLKPHPTTIPVDLLPTNENCPIIKDKVVKFWSFEMR